MTTTWRDDAACRDSGAEGFFPDSSDPREYDAPRAVCRRCTVRQECLADQLAWEGSIASGARHGMQAGAERVVRATADADAESPVACIRRPTATHTSCRCETCRPERNRMRKLTEAGLIPPSPAAQARAVLRGWMARGHSPAWIASATGLTLASAQHLTGDARRYDRKIGRHLAQVILRTDITSATAGLTDATGARRRLQALAAIGWSQMEIARRYDGHFVSLASIARGAQSHVGPRLHRLITTAYDDLAMTPGPHNRTRLDAARKGWAPPLAWDDETIDDPAAEPALSPTVDESAYLDEVAIARAMTGRPVRLTRDERREAVRRLDAAGRPPTKVLGLSGDTVARVRAEIASTPAGDEDTTTARRPA